MFFIDALPDLVPYHILKSPELVQGQLYAVDDPLAHSSAFSFHIVRECPGNFYRVNLFLSIVLVIYCIHRPVSKSFLGLRVSYALSILCKCSCIADVYKLSIFQLLPHVPYFITGVYHNVRNILSLKIYCDIMVDE